MHTLQLPLSPRNQTLPPTVCPLGQRRTGTSVTQEKQAQHPLCCLGQRQLLTTAPPGACLHTRSLAGWARSIKVAHPLWKPVTVRKPLGALVFKAPKWLPDHDVLPVLTAGDLKALSLRTLESIHDITPKAAPPRILKERLSPCKAPSCYCGHNASPRS